MTTTAATSATSGIATVGRSSYRAGQVRKENEAGTARLSLMEKVRGKAGACDSHSSVDQQSRLRL